jgi:hypothetical protein
MSRVREAFVVCALLVLVLACAMPNRPGSRSTDPLVTSQRDEFTGHTTRQSREFPLNSSGGIVTVARGQLPFLASPESSTILFNASYSSESWQ